MLMVDVYDGDEIITVAIFGNIVSLDRMMQEVFNATRINIAGNEVVYTDLLRDISYDVDIYDLSLDGNSLFEPCEVEGLEWYVFAHGEYECEV